MRNSPMHTGAPVPLLPLIWAYRACVPRGAWPYVGLPGGRRPLVSRAHRLFALGAPAPAYRAASEGQARAVVDAASEPLMANHHVPGMAVGIGANGKTYVFDDGVASAETGKPVTQRQ